MRKNDASEESEMSDERPASVSLRAKVIIVLLFLGLIAVIWFGLIPMQG